MGSLDGLMKMVGTLWDILEVEPDVLWKFVACIVLLDVLVLKPSIFDYFIVERFFFQNVIGLSIFLLYPCGLNMLWRRFFSFGKLTRTNVRLQQKIWMLVFFVEVCFPWDRRLAVIIFAGDFNFTHILWTDYFWGYFSALLAKLMVSSHFSSR